MPPKSHVETEKVTEQDLGLDEEDEKIIRKITGRAFLKVTEEKLRSYGMAGGPASVLADCTVSRCSLPNYEIQDSNKVFKRCMEEILGRLRTYGTLQPDSLEAMRDEYEAEDLICITENKQHKVPIGFAQNIKKLESAYETNKKKKRKREISKADDIAYSIEFTKKALDPKSEERQSLQNSVRKVLGLLVGLLKDRACVEDEKG
ncbi:hypothetical protein C1645_814574 [Glomus cerebriforme]|uniref:Uncharacterized protein n=1 Tax=Glomus cerebriforme TaxID=658196 RepID=A0A397TI46_9GLOM|nr:hypothetical protein C1645_814574 [Glomus cerebriforme]